MGLRRRAGKRGDPASVCRRSEVRRRAAVKGVEGRGAGWNYVDRTGKILCGDSFRVALDFSEGMAAVLPGLDRWGYVDDSCKLVIEARFHSAQKFSEGLAAVQKRTTTTKSFLSGSQASRPWAYIDRQGNVTIEVQAGQPRPFSGGLARVDMPLHYLDKQGAKIAPK